MRQLNAIVRREVGAFFHSILAPVLLGGFLVLVGLLFTKLMIGYSDLSTGAKSSLSSLFTLPLYRVQFLPNLFNPLPNQTPIRF